MAGSQRKPRKKATAALLALHERICAGGAHADCVTGVYAFGSYARGALTVGDVEWTPSSTTGSCIRPSNANSGGGRA